MVKRLASIPLIAVDPHATPTTEIATVHIPSAMVGAEDEGSAYRMDNVPIRMRKFVEPPEGILTDKEIIERIHERVKELKGTPSVIYERALEKPAVTVTAPSFDSLLQKAT